MVTSARIEKREPPRTSLIVQSDTIIVQVGNEPKKYTLHRKLPVYHSEYFRGTLSGQFKETDDGVVCISDINTDALDVFVDWTYERKLLDCVIGFGPSGKPNEPFRYRSYSLADRLFVPGMKRALMDIVFDVFKSTRRYLNLEWVVYVFKNLPKHNTMLKLLVGAFCVNDGVNKFGPPSIALVPDLPQDYLVRVLLKFHELNKTTAEDVKLKRKDYIVKEVSNQRKRVDAS